MNGITNFCKPQPPSPDVDLRPLLLRAENVGFQRNHRTILRNVNLDVRRGDFIAVTGPNGGGKTTLMRILLGLLKPTSGNVELMQKNVRISYLPQKSSIDSSFPISVREVVTSGIVKPTPDLDKQVNEAIRQVELENHADKPIGSLSGGQLQRTLLARAIISEPELLVLDEPLSYIDKHFEQKFYDIIRKLSEHTTIILVSHEISTIAAMANRHIIIDVGVTECRSAHHFARVLLCE